MFFSKQVSQTTELESRKDIMDGTFLNGPMGETWTVALKCGLNKPYFIELSKYVEIEQTHYTIYPPLDEVFSCTHHCTIHDIKVVILGQDPYHEEGQAHGLCFSVPEEIDQPRSLQNIFKVLNSDNIPEHGDLTKWAEQGVLLLNSALTVREGEANSHKNQGWEEFTDAVIEWISSNLNNVVFMLLDKYAQMKYSKIDETKGHLILESSHPSPQAAWRSFSVCGHFSEANDYLRTHGKPEIDWNL